MSVAVLENEWGALTIEDGSCPQDLEHCNHRHDVTRTFLAAIQEFQ